MNRITSIPKEKCLDSTIKLLLEGYLFIPNRCLKYHSDIFETRLMGQKVICMSGQKSAEQFYNKNLFTRKGVMPTRIKETLFGKNAIQTLEGPAHTNRKIMFLSLMTPEKTDIIVELARKQWKTNSKRWVLKDKIVLFDEVSKIMIQTACKWAGVPIKKSEIRLRASDMSAMIDAFGAVGPRHWKGRCSRNRSEAWARELIQLVRGSKINAPLDSALSRIAWHKNYYGELLTTKVAAVELLNILRPITAIATYVTFGALALHNHPDVKDRLKTGDMDYLHMVAQEIRRYYPFGPFLGARVRKDFTWRNCNFKKGTLVFQDIYGTNHDPRIWDQPNLFRPERFNEREGDAFDFIPQGGGSYEMGTRCPGEWITVELLKVSLDFLVNHMDYQVQLQDFSYRLNRIPTRPKDKFIMKQIRLLL